MQSNVKPVPSKEGIICGDILYWITLLGTVVALIGLVFGFITDNDYNSPSSWVSSVWDGRDTKGVWASNELTGVEGEISYLKVSGDELIADLEPDGSGVEYVISLSDGKLEETIPEGLNPAEMNQSGQTNASPLVVTTQGAEFTIRDQKGQILGTGTVSTDESPYDLPGEYSISTYAVGNLDDDQEDEVVLLANEVDNYPGQVYIADTDGTQISRFWNPGHVDAVTIADTDWDGKMNVVVGATNQDQLWSHISTPAIYDLEAPFEETEFEAPPYSGSIGKSDDEEEEWAEFPDTEEIPLKHWYLSHLGDGDGLATFGLAIGVFCVIPALLIPGLLYLRKKSYTFALLALLACAVTVASMLGMTPLPE